MKALIVLGVAVVAVVAVWFIMAVTYENKAIGLENKAAAQTTVNEAFFDKMWKVIQQYAEVSDEYKTTFKEVYPALMEGRYGDARGGALLSFITESNPDFDITLYANLQKAIEAQREGFFREQKKLTDLKLQHDDIRTTWPGRVFVGDRPEMEIKIVTSAKTDEVFNTGQENDVSLFGKDTGDGK